MWYIKYSTKTTKGRNRIGDKNKNEKNMGRNIKNTIDKI